MNLSNAYTHYLRRCSKRRVQPVDVYDWPFLKKQPIVRVRRSDAD